MKCKYEVVDLSHWNGVVDFNALKDNGIKGAILKVSGSENSKNYIDAKFETYYNRLKELGMYVGAYYFAGRDSNTMAKGIRDAKDFYSKIMDKQFELPVFYDFEWGDKYNKEGNTDAIIGFCSYMEGLKYYCGVYGSDINTFQEMVNDNKLKQYVHWVARYGKEPQFVSKYGIWQYTSSKRFLGNSCNFDVNKVYVDYAPTIKRLGLNGFGQPNGGENNGGF